MLASLWTRGKMPGSPLAPRCSTRASREVPNASVRSREWLCGLGAGNLAMDLYHNDQADFTRWVIANAYLQEPFVAVDVGVQGGEHIRWGLLGDRVRVYGFDALSEAIDRIAAQGQRPNRVYRAMAIGNEDGEREFYV